MNPFGKVDTIFERHLFLYKTIGANIRDAPTKRSNVKERELATPANFSDARNAPATSSVVNNINKCALNSAVFIIYL